MNRYRPRLNSRDRRGATAVEFAIVCPMVLLLVFGMFEVSRVMTISDTLRTGVIAGAREAGIAQTTSANVEAEIARILGVFRVRESDINVTPAVIDEAVTQVTITVQVPLNSSNGVYLSKVIGSDNMEFSTVLDR